MDTDNSINKTEEEKFNEDFIKVAFPDWMRSSKESNNFRGFVIDKHIVLENLMDLLITAYFFGSVNSIKSDSFRNGVLAYMDFSKKVRVIYKLKLIDDKLKGLIYQINDYRLSQAHIKKDDHFRELTKENWNKFQKISIEAHSKLISKIIMTDSNLRERIAKIANNKPA